jgi:hypothetical protein
MKKKSFIKPVIYVTDTQINNIPIADFMTCNISVLARIFCIVEYNIAEFYMLDDEHSFYMNETWKNEHAYDITLATFDRYFMTTAGPALNTPVEDISILNMQALQNASSYSIFSMTESQVQSLTTEKVAFLIQNRFFAAPSSNLTSDQINSLSVEQLSNSDNSIMEQFYIRIFLGDPLISQNARDVINEWASFNPDIVASAQSGIGINEMTPLQISLIGSEFLTIVTPEQMSRLTNEQIHFKDIDVNQHKPICDEIVKQTGSDYVPTIYLKDDKIMGKVEIQGKIWKIHFEIDC